jgi:hypothetical protein
MSDGYYDVNLTHPRAILERLETLLYIYQEMKDSKNYPSHDILTSMIDEVHYIINCVKNDLGDFE